jgi:crotonobetainyl-CoA:carnitine CoA-transferase CaiB-like acyl-CoA transferase
LAQRNAAEWVEILLAAGIPAGPIMNYAQALSSEHAIAREAVMEIEHPIEGRVKSIGFPVKLSETKQQVRRPPPLLGEHNEEILGELGIDSATRDALRAEGAGL